MLKSQNKLPASENTTASQEMARKEVLKDAETPNLLSASTVPTTIAAVTVDSAAAAITETVEKPDTRKVQQLPTREQKAKRPMTSSRRARTPAMM